jgi:N-acyl amino acid synthase of PEP-CTERM/exosortase system
VACFGFERGLLVRRGNSIIDVMEVHLISDKQSFDSCFDVFLADTPESKQIQYNLRYQVYCDEMGFEDKDKFPDQLESDEWDDGAVHFIVRHRYTGHWLGALRLVNQNQFMLPFEDKCTPDTMITAEQYLQAVEISRLCVLKEARRFAPKKYAPYGLVDEEVGKDDRNVRYLYSHKNQSRSIMWGLYRAAVVYSAQNNIKHWYILVTPALAYAVKKEGFQMLQVGSPCDHRGQRVPYLLDVEHILANPLWQRDYKHDFRLCSELAEETTSKRRVVY